MLLDAQDSERQHRSGGVEEPRAQPHLSQVFTDGAPRMITPERPAIRVFFVPRDRVEFRGNWDVMGLVGTGSFDYVVPEQKESCAAASA